MESTLWELCAFVRPLRPSDARNRLPVMAARALGECGPSRVAWGRPGGSRTTLMCHKVLESVIKCYKLL